MSDLTVQFLIFYILIKSSEYRKTKLLFKSYGEVAETREYLIEFFSNKILLFHHLVRTRIFTEFDRFD